MKLQLHEKVFVQDVRTKHMFKVKNSLTTVKISFRDRFTKKAIKPVKVGTPIYDRIIRFLAGQKNLAKDFVRVS